MYRIAPTGQSNIRRWKLLSYKNIAILESQSVKNLAREFLNEFINTSLGNQDLASL